MVKKGKRRQADADGRVRLEEVRYLGYKSHTSVNAKTGLITSLVPTVGGAADNKQFPSLLAHDEGLGVQAEIYTADRGALQAWQPQC